MSTIPQCSAFVRFPKQISLLRPPHYRISRLYLAVSVTLLRHDYSFKQYFGRLHIQLVRQMYVSC